MAVFSANRFPLLLRLRPPFLRRTLGRTGSPGAVFALLAALLLPASPARAQDIAEYAGTTEFQYLQNLIYARPAALAGSYSALAEGLDAIGSNPAGLARIQNRFFSGTLRYHQLGITTGNATYSYPGALGLQYALSLAYVNYGQIAERDENGSLTGKDIIPTSFNPSLTAAKNLGPRLRGGITLKLLSEYLGDFEESQMAVGWGLDAGIQYQPALRGLGFGVEVLNLGRKERAHTADGRIGGLLPGSLKGGLFYQPADRRGTRLLADLELPFLDSPLFSFGVEQALNPFFLLRAGTRLDYHEAKYLALVALAQEDRDFHGGNAMKLTGGFGVLWEGLSLDYAAQWWRDLSLVHAVTVRGGVGI